MHPPPGDHANGNLKVYDDVSLEEMREAVERLSAPRRRWAGGDQSSLGLTEVE